VKRGLEGRAFVGANAILILSNALIVSFRFPGSRNSPITPRTRLPGLLILRNMLMWLLSRAPVLGIQVGFFVGPGLCVPPWLGWTGGSGRKQLLLTIAD